MPATTRLLSPEAHRASYELQLQSSSASHRGLYLQSPHYVAKRVSIVTSPPQTNIQSSNKATSLESPLKSKVQTKIYPTSTPLHREASSKPANECISRDDFRKRIIAAITDGDNVREVEEFLDVSKDDYLYVLDAIDDEKITRKLAYASELKLLTATLPNRLHQSYLTPVSATLLGAVGSMGIPYRFGQIRLRSDVTLLSIIGVRLGVPDMLMEYVDPDGDCIPLWATEVSVSQTKKSATNRLREYMTDREDLLAISLVDVKEVKKHTGPQSGSEAIEVLEGKPSVSTFPEWLSSTVIDDEDPIVMKTFGHTWQHPITATITTWLRHPNGSFNMNDSDPDFCANRCMFSLPSFHSIFDRLQSLFPERDDLEDVDHVFRRTLERVRDHVVSLIKVRSPHDVNSSAFDPIRTWSPPTPLIDWNDLAHEIVVGARQTGYGRYATWHDRIIKRKAEEDEVTTGGSGSTKKTRTA